MGLYRNEVPASTLVGSALQDLQIKVHKVILACINMKVALVTIKGPPSLIVLCRKTTISGYLKSNLARTCTIEPKGNFLIHIKFHATIHIQIQLYLTSII